MIHDCPIGTCDRCDAKRQREQDAKCRNRAAVADRPPYHCGPLRRASSYESLVRALRFRVGVALLRVAVVLLRPWPIMEMPR